MSTSSTFAGRRGKASRKSAAPRTNKKRRKKRPVRWYLLALLLFGGVATLPGVLSYTTLLSGVIVRQVGPLNGTFTVAQSSVGWFSPLTLNQVVIRDAERLPVVSVERIQTERGLLHLLWDSGNLGTVTITEPEAELEIQQDGSTNLAELFAPLLHRQGSGPVDLPFGSLKLEQGTIRIKDHQGSIIVCGPVRLIASRLGADTGVTLELSAPLHYAQGKGKIDVSVALPVDLLNRPTVERSFVGRSFKTEPQAGDVTEQGKETAKNEIAIHAERIPLAPLAALLQRFSPGARFVGTTSLDVTGRFANNGLLPLNWQIALAVDDLSGSLPSHLSDPVLLRQANMNSSGAWSGDRLNIDRFSFKSDVGQADVEGPINISLIAGAVDWSALAQETLQGQGSVDVAKLANMLPHTLRLRKGLRLEAGEVQWSLSRLPKGQQHLWQGHFLAENMIANEGGRTIRWEQPLSFTAAVSESEAGFTVEQFVVDSTFLKGNISGDFSNLQGQATIDLAQLASQLGEFIDLDQTTVAGRAKADLNWNRSTDGNFSTQAQVRLSDLQWKSPGGLQVDEKQLMMDVAARGMIDSTALKRIDQAQVELTTDSAHALVELTEEVSHPMASAKFPLKWEFQGTLDQVVGKLAALSLPRGWQIAGDCQASGQVSMKQGSLQGGEMDALFSSFLLIGPALHVSQPTVRVVARAEKDQQAGAFTLQDITLSSPAIQARGEQLRWSPSGSIFPGGKLSYRADLGQLSQWLVTADSTTARRISGTLQGIATLAPDGSNISLRSTSEITSLKVEQYQPSRPGQSARWAVLLEEPKVAIALDGGVDIERKTMQLTQARFQSHLAQVLAQGSVEPRSGEPYLNLTGKVNYDLADVTRMLRPNWGDDIKLVGKQEHSFAIEGPIVQLATSDTPRGNLSPGPRSSLLALKGELELGWQRAELFGIAINRSTIPAALANGQLRVGPTRLPVGSGSVGLDGTLQFAPPPRLLTLTPGDLVSRVELTPNMCASGIKYVAPLLAEATQTQGSFSLQLTQAQLPMSDPASGVVDGRLTIHSGQVRPGPLAQAIVGLTNQIIGAIDRNGGQALGGLNLNNPLLTIEEQTTDFRLVQRRVYHRGMQIHFGTVQVNSRGSVGLDQSLDIVVDIPVQNRWFAKKPDLAKAFNGTILSIPIRGTLHQPQIDNQVLGQLLAQFATEMLQNSAEDLIIQGLDRLFRPRNP